MKMLKEENIITCESYKGLCDYVYKAGDEPKSGLVHVNMEEIPSFFEAIKGREDRYVVVSSCSDFGLCIQEQNPVWADMPKWARMMTTPEIGYQGVNIAPRCDLNKCRIEDKYSVKCYAYTAFTFSAIPDNIVHWFMTNSRVNEPNITTIPFGIAPGAAPSIVKVRNETKFFAKEPKLYVNWVNYTIERLELKEHYRQWNLPDVVIVDEAKPYEDYLRDLAKYAGIIAPEGNGIDCYRMLEAIYMGSLPIVQPNNVTYSLMELPMAIVLNMYGLRAKEMYGIFQHILAQNRSLNGVSLSYWKERFYKMKEDNLWVTHYSH